ncbi:DUF3124 domain-containing protein [Flammeovirga pacifica]|uniref:DUF3124 domain-containing protein n=1 Tax=Flammeovirga pacifica TaxID=915059 RepID=UPI0008F8C14F|nr:DUF3124 domain-containing protein [Flammeovirga pacifica]
MTKQSTLSLILLLIISLGCRSLEDLSDTKEQQIEDEINKKEVPHLSFKETYYVSAYAEIKGLEKRKRTPCITVLNLRNPSLSDTLYFTKVDYYNSNAELIERHIKEEGVIELTPLKSAEFVIEKNINESNGSHIIVEYGGVTPPKNKALIEAVNIGNFSQHGFSFKSDVVQIHE